MAIKVGGGTQDGVYADNTTSGLFHDKKVFSLLGTNFEAGPTVSSISWSLDLNNDFAAGPFSAGWSLLDGGGALLYYSLSDVLTPDLAVPDTTAIRVTGGSDTHTNGVWLKANTQVNGKSSFNFLGYPAYPTSDYALRWSLNLLSDFGFGPASAGFGIYGPNHPDDSYYSLSAVATPNLATNWKNATDDTAAPISVFINDVTWFNATDNSPASITVTHFNIHKMNLYNLKNVCAAFHNKTVDDLTVAGVDLFIIAANNAKKGAEKLHNFELEWVKATISVDYLTGGLFSSATTVPANTFSGLKEILSVSGTVNNCVVPIRFTRPKGVPQSYDWNMPRYPTDSQVMSSGSSCPLGLVFRGDSIVIYPTQTTAGTLPITVEGYGWLNDYNTDQVADEDADPQDFLLAYGFDFLQWSIIIELNYAFQTFVNRQEGNVGTPTKMRDDAWEDLVDWDSNRIDPHIRDTR